MTVTLLDMNTERELKYFVLSSVLKQLTNLKKAPKKNLAQSYFADECMEAAYRLTFKPKDEMPKLATGRLRMSSNGGASKYFVTFKGPYLSEFSRNEFEKEITKSLYDLLLPLCSGHTVKKARYLVDGHLLINSKRIKVTAEVDHLIEWSDGFVTVDIEVEKDSHIEAIRQGHHTFDFLKLGAIDLTKEKFAVRRALSMKFLARNGFTSSTRKIVSNLTKKSLKALISTPKSLRGLGR